MAQGVHYDGWLIRSIDIDFVFRPIDVDQAILGFTLSDSACDSPLHLDFSLGFAVCRSAAVREPAVCCFLQSTVDVAWRCRLPTAPHEYTELGGVFM